MPPPPPCRIGELVGHTASVSHIALDDKLNHVFTLSVDKVIKVWDLRNHKCLQTICQVGACATTSACRPSAR